MFVEFQDDFENTPILINTDAIEAILVVDDRIRVNIKGSEGGYFIKGDWDKIKEVLNGKTNDVI